MSKNAPEGVFAAGKLVSGGYVRHETVGCGAKLVDRFRGRDVQRPEIGIAPGEIRGLFGHDDGSKTMPSSSHIQIPWGPLT